MERESHERGFTFPELLVVLGCLVVLLSIFVPYVGKLRETERRREDDREARAAIVRSQHK